MKAYPSNEIRNIAFVGHGRSGKTSLTDAAVFDVGASTRLGRTEDSTSLFDLEPEEIHRGGSMTTHFNWVEHGGTKINMIDTPGDQNFFLDGVSAMYGADALVVVVSASGGVQLQTKRAWAEADKHGLSRAIVINKMDRASADWQGLVNKVGTSLNAQPVAIQVPMGAGEAFNGVVDLFRQKAITWPNDAPGKATEGEIPADLTDMVAEARANMIESIVSTDDALLETYLDTGDVSEEQVKKAFNSAMAQNKVVPVLFTNAKLNIGVRPLLDLVAACFPNPLDRKTLEGTDEQGNAVEIKVDENEPFVGQIIKTLFDEHAGQISMIRVFSGSTSSEASVRNAASRDEMRLGHPYFLRGKERTKGEQIVCGDIIAAVKLKDVHTGNTLCDPKSVRNLPKVQYPDPMMSLVLIAQDKKDTDKIKTAASQAMEEDPSLSLTSDEMTHQMILNGMGNAHVECAIDRMNRKFKINITTDLPSVPYRETLAKPVKNVEGKHKKQSGGAGQFGLCYCDFEPTPMGSGFEFVNKIFGGAIPKQFIPAVEKGVVDKAKSGSLAGYPVVDFKVTLIDGKHHPVDSKDIAFQLAGVKAMKGAMAKAGMKLLEPYYKMDIMVPSDSAGDIMGDVTSRRGQIAGMDTEGDMTIIHATCPLAEIQQYVADLQSMTQGKGSFTRSFDTFRDVPGNLVEKIQKASPFLKKDEDDDE